MADVSEVPIVDVHLGNYRELWPSLVLAVQSSSFLAIDTELSGLGDRKLISSKSVEDRYKAIADTAQTRSIISLGLSCFRCLPNSAPDIKSADDGKNRLDMTKYVVQTFNILVLCTESYVVEPLSLKFLVEHGFDFNQQYSLGLPYSRGNDASAGILLQSLRRLFADIILARVPIVFHNALFDLVFLYESFYASLPSSLSSFLTDLTQMFPSGIYDTKYIAEFIARMQASFLEYTFRRSLRENSSRMSHGLTFVNVSFLSYSAAMRQHVIMSPCGLTHRPCLRDVGKLSICKHFAEHGWCQVGIGCPKSHNVDMILDAEEWIITKKKKKKSKQRKHRTVETSVRHKAEEMAMNGDVSPETNDEEDTDEYDEKTMNFSSNCDVASTCERSVKCMQIGGGILDSVLETNSIIEHNSPTPPMAFDTGVNRVAGHRAGFDAFMTGYTYAAFSTTRHRNNTGESFGGCIVLDDAANKICLCGKTFPLQIVQSNFAKPSREHVEKWKRLQMPTPG